MGVDISGRNPIIRGVKPTIDWDTASEKEKDAYWKKAAKWEKKNPGDYFRANWWSWRPIVGLVNELNLDIDTVSWGFNDGAGIETHDDCVILADALENFINETPTLIEDDDRVHLVMGSWVDLQGNFVSTTHLDEFEHQLPDSGTIMFSSFIAPDGTILQSAHSVTKGHLKQFIEFLRECGGFDIW